MLSAVFGLLACFAEGAHASDSVSYMEASYTAENGVTYTEKTADATALTSSSTSLSNGWYYVTGNVTVSSRITVSGTANLILCDGATLTASKGITVATDADGDNPSTLNIYAQSAGTGKLIAKGIENFSGIGGYGDTENYDFYKGGTINIHGGTIEATGGEKGAGIGGGRGGYGGTLTIYGGTITADGGEEGAGIGGGDCHGGGTIIIYGGTVTANGKNGAAGIGGGGNGEENGGATIEIYGGTVNATGSEFGAGIGGGEFGNGGTVTIYGGTVTANGGGDAAGIGGGLQRDGGTVTIYGGTVNANGGANGAGIGGGYKGSGGTVEINGGKVTANGGVTTNGGEEAQGIGRGSYDKDEGTPGIGSLTVGSGLVVFSGGSTIVITDYSNNRERYMQVEKGYSVSFDKNASDAAGTMDVHGGRESSSYALTLPANSFARGSNYTFGSWNTSAEGTGTSYADKASVTLTTSLTLYAQWSPVRYEISYDLGGGQLSDLITSYDVETATFTIARPTKTGYTFTGWSSECITGAVQRRNNSVGVIRQPQIHGNMADRCVHDNLQPEGRYGIA